MNEWEFTADVASWINEILARNGGLPFVRAKCEQTGSGSRKRRDLTLLGSSHLPVLTGEVKLPYRQDGGSPYVARVVADARKKAAKAGAKFFFTWNVNEFVLWETVASKTSWQEQNYRAWHVANVHRESQLEHPMVLEAIRDWLAVFLNDFAKVLLGTTPIGHKLPDEKFVEALESSLRMPVLLNLDEIASLYKRAPFRARLEQWMRDVQGWVIHKDPEGIHFNLERATRFACYGLVNKLVFYEALLKRYGVKMDRLAVPPHVTAGEQLRLHLEGSFAEAKRVTRDYETVFGETHQSIGNQLPFCSDAAVPHWRQLVDQIHRFDFSKLDYEVIGAMCERLLSPEERHKFGQHYTRVEVVDLINSFCIRTGDETVMDPACGGGTFLVRAYARKRELSPGRKHGELLKEIFGVDVSSFATHLTTINLATRDLVDEENYPQIVRSDFFDVQAARPFLSLPTRLRSKGLGDRTLRTVDIRAIDAVVGNPPYVRQEDIPKSPSKVRGPKPGTKDYFLLLAKQEAGAEFSARSDVHCYFWPHASSFLKADGHLCFVTSSQWLDVEYGFRMQDWILKHFRILAVFESIDEPWFVGARVATAVTVLCKEKDHDKRMENTVRFVQLRRPMREILAHDGTTPGALAAADAFRDEVLSLAGNTSNDRYRARLVRQGDLWEQGVKLGVVMRGPRGTDAQEERAAPTVAEDQYYGGKWGVFLRAPDLWFRLMEQYGPALAPLGKIAEVRFGVKSGKDGFFFPKDCSQDSLNEHPQPSMFEAEYGVPRKEVETGKVRLVLCGEGRGEIRPIEAKYLEPEVHSLMEVDQFSVQAQSSRYYILLVGGPRSAIAGTYVGEYVRWGESKGFHKSPTCSARATEGREWYDLTAHRRPDIILPKIQQYRLMAFLNPGRLYQNSSLLGIYDVPDALVRALCGVLNSTIAVLSRLVYARIHGNEGNIQLDVYSARMMPVPNVFACPEGKVVDRITDIFTRMTERKVVSFVSERRLRAMSYTAKGRDETLDLLPDVGELDMQDRHELDDAVLQMMGVKRKRERDALIGELYGYLREFFEWTRQKEEKAIVNKKKTARRGPAKPAEIAAEIHRDISENEPALLRSFDSTFLDKSKPFDTLDLPPDGQPAAYGDMFVGHGVDFRKGKKRVALVETRIPEQVALLVLLAGAGTRGLVRVPHEAEECRNAFRTYGRFIQDRDARIREIIASRTSDEDLQMEIEKAVRTLLASPT